MKSVLFSGLLVSGLFFTNSHLEAKNAWVLGVDYQHLSSEVDYFGTNVNFDVGVVNAFFGYRMTLNERWTMTTTVNAGVGVKPEDTQQLVVFGDILADIDMKVDSSFGIQSEFIASLNENNSLFISPGFKRYDYNARQAGFDELSIADWDLSFGVGYIYDFSSEHRIKVSYIYMPNTNFISLAYETHF